MSIQVSPFLFSCYGVHRDLHSFPTRRSSDLVLSGCSDSTSIVTIAIAGGSSPGRRDRSAAWGGRSEEHTSELQSLRHLVCRLLLEKKKKEQKGYSDLISNDVPKMTITREVEK